MGQVYNKNNLFDNYGFFLPANYLLYNILEQLTIYRASAGSGKTWTLTRDYLSLLINFPDNHRHILAVTFTNKATEEMKSRILHELHKLAAGIDSGLKDYFIDTFRIDELRLRERARLILNTILHNYSRFHIGTIDSFFQKVIRSFARELDLTAAYHIELDTEKVLTAAIDRLLYRLDEQQPLHNWLLQYSRNKIREGLNWKISDNIRQLGFELFREGYQQYGRVLEDKISDKKLMQAYQDDLQAIRSSYLERFRSLAREAEQVIDSLGLHEDDFHQKSRGIGRFFSSVSRGERTEINAAAIRCLDNRQEWIPGTSSKKYLLEEAYRRANPVLKKMVLLHESDHPEYKTADAILKNIYILGILTDLSAEIYKLTDEQDIFLISDTARFLKEIIAGNNPSFVYEKTGSYLDFYMIDEFQDTSAFQWANLAPLLQESLAASNRSLVVGDVKQSIYRWRNSDWEILGGQINEQFADEQLDEQVLNYNWRSGQRLIEFNNRFFTEAANLVAGMVCPDTHEGPEDHPFSEKVRRAYADVVQEFPEGKEKGTGYARIGFIAEKGSGFIEEADRQLITALEELLDAGCRQRDIAILVRKRNEGKHIADLLLDQNRSQVAKNHEPYRVISNESLMLAHAPAVKFLVHLLRYLDDANDALNFAELQYHYLVFVPSPDATAAGAGLFMDDTHAATLKERIAGVAHLPLNELIQKSIHIFGLDKVPEYTAYLLAFQDVVLDYSRQEVNDVHSFLEWWRLNGHKEALNMPEEQDAIRIMTIHKAKGLQFKAVLVPYCRWKLDHEQSQVMWFVPPGHPYDLLPVVPVNYASTLKETMFRDQYDQERFRIHVDNLNLLYVAFTRAVEALVVTAAAPASGKKISTVGDLLAAGLHHEPEKGGMTWETGVLRHIHGTESRSASVAVPLAAASSSAGKGQLKMRSGELDFFDEQVRMKLDRGRIMHRIFEGIRIPADVPHAVRTLRRQGKVGMEEEQPLVREIRELISIEPVCEWFDGSWTVRNEQDILTPSGTVFRPDRVISREGRVVVIDYKFGRRKLDQYTRQMKKYLQLLREMGYAEAEAYIWYVFMREVIHIN